MPGHGVLRCGGGDVCERAGDVRQPGVVALAGRHVLELPACRGWQQVVDRETLDEDEAYAAAGISRDTAPATGARAAARLVTARTPPVRKKSSAERAGFHAPAGG